MKILMTCEGYLPKIGGAEIHIDNLIKRLVDQNHQVVFLTNYPGQTELDRQGIIKRIPWKRSNLITIWKFLWKQASVADVLHAHYCNRLAFFLGIIGKLKAKPVIITLHGYGILDHPEQSWLNKQKHKFYRFWSLMLASKIISTSQDLADIAYRYVSKTKVVVISNGYNETLFNTGVVVPDNLITKYSGKKIILTVRRLLPKNGIQYLVEALPKIFEAVPDSKLLVIGDGGMRAQIELRIQSLGVLSKVDFMGALSNDKVPVYLALADVIVFPSTAESSSIACAEAMAMGKKVVASRVGGLVELLDQGQERGWLVDMMPWSHSSYDAPKTLPQESYIRLARGVIDALNTRGDEKISKAKEFAQSNLSWNIITKKTIDVYTSVYTRVETS